MVALKPLSPVGTDGVTGGKQERRGGIETAALRDLPNPLHMKQERRGGIETGYPLLISLIAM